jgi:formylglycine-generating enzyme required for sulfatase activity
MLEVHSADGRSYCIDTHEVTVARYQLYLATSPPPITAADCVGENPEPAKWLESDWDPALPVHYTKWCQADAFCAANAKRLCGRIGGGPLDGSDESVIDATQSEWFNACSAAGTRTNPYGDGYEADRCAPGTIEGVEALEPPGSRPECEGGFPGLFDMNGNVSEHENGCSYIPPTPPGTEWEDFYWCAHRGRLAEDATMGCHFQRSGSTSSDSARGIRCCADVIEENAP